jgi:hypothetical protein
VRSDLSRTLLIVPSVCSATVPRQSRVLTAAGPLCARYSMQPGNSLRRYSSASDQTWANPSPRRACAGSYILIECTWYHERAHHNQPTARARARRSRRAHRPRTKPRPARGSRGSGVARGRKWITAESQRPRPSSPWGAGRRRSDRTRPGRASAEGRPEHVGPQKGARAVERTPNTTRFSCSSRPCDRYELGSA